MYKYRLMAPGPTPIPEVVLNEMANPITHHRTPGFEKVVAEVQENLKWLYQTKNDIIVLASSGSGGMEASLVNTCKPGDSVLVVNGGKFGERFAKIAKSHGLNPIVIDVEWGHAVDPQAIKDKLSSENIRAVCVQASETSTGVMHPIESISKIVSEHKDTLLIVDAITALGVINIPTDDWGIDILLGGSQKGLMLPPGIATMSVSDKAWALIEKNDTHKFYFNLNAERKALKNNTTAWTPAVTLFFGLRKVLSMMKEEGLENMFARHETMASSIRNAAQAVGLKLLAPEAPSNSVTAIYSPDNIDSGKIVAGLRDDFNMTIANGQDHLKGKIFRIGHIGYFDNLDMVAAWSAVEKQLMTLGHKFELGKGVAEIIKIL